MKMITKVKTFYQDSDNFDEIINSFINHKEIKSIKSSVYELHREFIDIKFSTTWDGCDAQIRYHCCLIYKTNEDYFNL